MTKEEILELVEKTRKSITTKIEGYLKEGKSYDEISSLLNIPIPELEKFMVPTEHTLIKTQYFIMLVMEETGITHLFCGNDDTIARFLEKSRIFLIGAASPGVKPGLIGTFLNVTIDNFFEAMEIR